MVTDGDSSVPLLLEDEEQDDSGKSAFALLELARFNFCR
jgi:hypothetical protein